MTISSQSFVFIGRSGCGKGTQAKLLEEYLRKTDPSKGVLYIQTGGELREFAKGQSFTQKACKTLNEIGGLQPEFVAVYLWISVIINKYTGNEHIIFDGTPRKYHEAVVLDSVFDFYKFGKPFILNIDISNEESVKRLLARKRIDDGEKEIKKRLSWYETEVIPTLDYFKDNKNYNFLVIDGERSVEEIHRDIIGKIGLKGVEEQSVKDKVGRVKGVK
ncbi:MAG TPA: nucleoside monophosphate kinase [Candidatus Paceibacterota bacterium]